MTTLYVNGIGNTQFQWDIFFIVLTHRYNYTFSKINDER